MTRRIPVVVLVLALLGAVPVTAQTLQQKRLKGLTGAKVVIEELDDDSATCGITKAGLTTAASKALLDNGVRVDARAFPTLYVNVTSLYSEAIRRCTSNVHIELYENLTATPRHSAQPVFGQFILTAPPSSVFASSPSAHGQRIRDAVFEYVEEIAVDIRIANQ
jgi:hypothetical protein